MKRELSHSEDMALLTASSRFTPENYVFLKTVIRDTYERTLDAQSFRRGGKGADEGTEDRMACLRLLTLVEYLEKAYAGEASASPEEAL